MPLLTDVHLKGQRVTGWGATGGRDWTCKWMGEVMEEGEGESPERNQQQQQRLNQTPGDGKHTFWSQTLRTFRPWYSFASVGVVWFFCQLEALLHPSLPLEDLCCRLFLLCLLWLVVGGCIHGLRCCLRPGPTQEEPPQMKQQVVKTRNLFSWMPQSRSPDVPLTAALTDCLLLCLLQEPLQDPSVSHIKALLSKLEAVAHTLQNAGAEEHRGSEPADKLKLLCTYLQQRTQSLHALVQVQEDFEVSVKDLLQGFDDLWTQLEELHTGVTLTKQEGQGHRDPTSVQTDSETLVAELGQYRNKLQSCEARLKDSTQLAQELTWNHNHLSNKVHSSSSSSSSSEAVWPEILLQSNIEQFDKVHESFTSLDQQISTFQTHLEGLGKGTHNRRAGPPAPRFSAPQTSCSAADQTPPSLQRSAMKISDAFGCFHRPGKKK